jgi:FkbM family methyltransferase
MNLYQTINSLINKTIYLIDVGAYKGEFTDNFLNNIDKIKYVDMYEPQNSSFSDLQNKFENIENINIFNIAIGYENTQKEFFYFENEGYKSSLLKPIEGGGSNVYCRNKNLG